MLNFIPLFNPLTGEMNPDGHEPAPGIAVSFRLRNGTLKHGVTGRSIVPVVDSPTKESTTRMVFVETGLAGFPLAYFTEQDVVEWRSVSEEWATSADILKLSEEAHNI